MDKSRKGVVLLAHGARNAEWATPFQRVRQLLLEKQPDLPVELAFLEFMQPDLPTAVEQMAQQGIGTITVAPLFFGYSGHVLKNVLPMIEQLRQAHPALALRLASVAGEDAGVLEALAAYCVRALAEPG